MSLFVVDNALLKQFKLKINLSRNNYEHLWWLNSERQKEANIKRICSFVKDFGNFYEKKLRNIVEYSRRKTNLLRTRPHVYMPTGAQRVKFAEKVHKPPLWFNVINFELNGFNASILVNWSPSDPKKSWCTNRNIQINKIKKLHVCTYSPVQFTLKFVNLFVEVNRVWGVPDLIFWRWTWRLNPRNLLRQAVTILKT